MNFRPLRDLVLVKMPDPPQDFLTLNAIKYHPTSGKVVEDFFYCENNGRADEKKWFLFAGDTAYFSKLMWSRAKEAAFGSYDERDHTMYQGSETFAVIQDGQPYMLIPFKYLYCVNMSGGLMMLNGNITCNPSARIAPNGLFIDDGREEDYALNECVVESGDEYFAQRDLVQTLAHCDIYLESLGEETKLFIIEAENVISKYTPMGYQATPNRLIVSEIEADKDSDSFYDADKDPFNMRQTLMLVEHVGEGITGVKAGDQVVTARASAKKLPLRGDTKQYLVVDFMDCFSIVEK